MGSGAGAISGGDIRAGISVGLAGPVAFDADFAGITLNVIAAYGGEAGICLRVAEFAISTIIGARAGAAGGFGDTFLRPVTDLTFRAGIAQATFRLRRIAAADAVIAGNIARAVVGEGAFRGGAGALRVGVGFIADLAVGAEFAGGFDTDIAGTTDGPQRAVEVNFAAYGIAADVVFTAGAKREEKGQTQGQRQS